MSYISISTNQPSRGQRQLTEREPANLRNDFKVPIEINVGDTVELVSLKFNVNAIVIDDTNNRIVWSVGLAPYSCYHCALIPEDAYDSPFHLAEGIAEAFNNSTLLPNYQQQAVSNHFGFANIPGWTAVWDTTGTVGKFVITANQCESSGRKTNGSLANALYTSIEPTYGAVTARAIAGGIAVNNQLIFDEELPSGGPLGLISRNRIIEISGGETQLDSQVFAAKRWSATSAAAEELALSLFLIATDDTQATIDELGLIGEEVDSPEFWFNSEDNQLGNNGGHSFETSRQSQTLVIESQESVDIEGETSSFVSDMGGIYNNGGIVRAEVYPIVGFSLADFTTSGPATTNFIGQSLQVSLQLYDVDGNASVIERDMTAAVAPTGGGSNGWHITLTSTSGNFDATGQGGPDVDSVLWLAYLPELTVPDYGLLKTYYNGMFVMGFTPGGGASAPPDANDPVNWNAFIDPTNKRARNYWYYDMDSGHFSCAYRQRVEPDAAAEVDNDQYTRPARVPHIIAGLAFDPPTILNTAQLDMDLIPTQPLGYPACTLGLNRRERFTPNYISQNDNEFSGYKSITDSTVGSYNHEICEYSISINNGDPGDGEVEVDPTTGARVPIVTMTCPQPFVTFTGANNENIDKGVIPVGNEDWLESETFVEKRFTDGSLGLAAFDPTQSIFLELQLNINNELTYTIAQEPQTTISSTNPFPAEIASYTNKFSETITSDPASSTGGLCQITEAQFPLIPTIAVGGGGYYGIGASPTERNVGVAYKLDMSGPYRVPSKGVTSINPRLSFEDAYDQTSIKQNFTTESTGGRMENQRDLVCVRRGAADAAREPRVTTVQLDRTKTTRYNSGLQFPTGTVVPGLFDENADAILALNPNSGGVTGFDGLYQVVINPPIVKSEFTSVNKISFNGIEDGLSVNLLNGNIKGFNGGTADINKAIAYLQPEQLLSTATGVGSRTFFHESKTSRPVEFNVPQNQLAQSMTIQLRNNNNELVRGIEAPVEVILYKRSKNNELQEIKQVLNSIKSDRQGIKIQTSGDNNPLLGVIPS